MAFFVRLDKSFAVGSNERVAMKVIKRVTGGILCAALLSGVQPSKSSAR